MGGLLWDAMGFAMGCYGMLWDATGLAMGCYGVCYGMLRGAMGCYGVCYEKHSNPRRSTPKHSSPDAAPQNFKTFLSFERNNAAGPDTAPQNAAAQTQHPKI